MPRLNHRMIRLLATVVCSSVAIAIMVYYTAREVSYFSYIPISIGVLNVVILFSHYGPWGFAVPVIGLIAGIWLIFKRPRSLVAFELLIFGLWLFTILFAGYCFLGWQAENGELADKELMLIQAGEKAAPLNGD